MVVLDAVGAVVERHLDVERVCDCFHPVLKEDAAVQNACTEDERDP